MDSNATALTWGKRGLLGLMAVLLVTFGLRATGTAVARIDVQDGSVWLASPPMGMVMQVNAASDQVLSTVKVAEPGNELTVSQAGHSALVLDRSSGQLGRIDGATLDFTGDPIVDGPTGSLQMVGNQLGAYVLDSGRGTVLVLDPADRRVLHEVTVPQGRAQMRIDPAGKLWMLAQATGTVVRIDPDGHTAQAGAAPAEGNSSLVLVGDQPYVINPLNGRVVAIDQGSAKPGADSCLGVDSGDEVVATGSGDGSRALAVAADPGTGQLATADLEADACVGLQLTSAGQQLPVAYGEPVTAGDVAYIPVLDRGEVLIVDLAENRTLQTTQVVLVKGTRFELLVDDGNVWFNSLTTPEAGVLDRNGIKNIVSKYGEQGADGTGDSASVLGLDAEKGEGVDVDAATGKISTDRPAEGEGGTGTGTGTGADGSDTGPEGLDGLDATATAPKAAQIQILPSDPLAGTGPNAAPAPLPSGPSGAGSGPISGGSTLKPLPVGPSGGDNSGTQKPLPSPGQTPDTTPPQRLTPSFTFDVKVPQIGQQVRFIDTSQVPAGKPAVTSWTWDFGDGSPAATTSDLQHVFATAGSFLVRLTVSNGAETATSAATSIQVVDRSVPSPPVPEFSFSPVNPEVGQKIGFDGDTTVPPPNCCPVTEWRWDFGDGTAVQTGKATSHTYAKPGEYTVILTAFNSASPGTVTRRVVVVPEVLKPVASFSVTPKNPVEGQTVTFKDTSEGGVSERQWSVDGAQPEAALFTTTFAKAGAYPVKLTVKNAKGSDNTTTVVVVAAASRAPSITSGGVAPFSPEVGELTALSASADSGPTSWVWDYGDGTPLQTNNDTVTSRVAHSWSAPGIYESKAVARNPQGSSAPYVTRIVVRAKQPGERLDAGFTSKPSGSLGDAVGVGQAVQFTDTTKGGPAVRWEWDFGDGVTGQGQNPTHAYASAGLKVVNMAAYDAAGIGSVAQPHLLVVREADVPQADFSWNPNQPVAGQAVQFTNLSQNRPNAYRWDFGDSTDPVLGPTASPVHVFASAGTYQVTLIVARGGTQSAPRTQNIVVSAQAKAPPAAAFQVSEPDDQWVAGKPITFVNTTPGAVSAPVFTFSPGGDQTPGAGSQQVTYTPTAPGPLTVTMKVCWADDPGNCATAAARTLNVQPAAQPPNASFTVSPVHANGDPQTVRAGTDITFTASGPGTNTYTWTIDGLAATGQSVSHNFDQGGDVTVRLVARNSAGVVAESAKVLRVVVPTPPTAAFTAPDAYFQYAEVSFVDGSTGATSYQWNFGDGNTSTEASPKHVYATAGPFQVSLTVTNEFGPSDPVTKTITIQALSVPTPKIGVTGATLVSEGNYTATAGATLTFTDTVEPTAPAPLTSWQWTFGTDPVPVAARTVQRAFAPGVYPVRLQSANPAGNGATQQVSIVVT